MRAPRLIATLLTVGVIAAPAVALAFAAPSRPAAGKWKIYGGGGFTVSKDRKSISGLHIKPSAADFCGTATISVHGKQKLSLTSRGGYTNWIVGRSTPKTSSGVTPIKVKVSQAGHTVPGTMDLIFAVAGVSRSNDGDLLFGSCSLVFYAKR